MIQTQRVPVYAFNDLLEDLQFLRQKQVVFSLKKAR